MDAMTLTYSTVAHRLLIARVDRKLTQRALARMLGISHVALGHWERGKSVPSIARIESLASALGVNHAWLAFGAGPMR